MRDRCTAARAWGQDTVGEGKHSLPSQSLHLGSSEIADRKSRPAWSCRVGAPEGIVQTGGWRGLLIRPEQ